MMIPKPDDFNTGELGLNSVAMKFVAAHDSIVGSRSEVIRPLVPGVSFHHQVTKR